MSRIIIGVDGSERSEDAVAFGRMLAQASGAPATSSEHGEFLREGAETTLERMSDPLRELPGLETRSVADRSLQDVANRARRTVQQPLGSADGQHPARAPCVARPNDDAPGDLAHGFSATLHVIRVLESEHRVHPSELGGR